MTRDPPELVRDLALRLASDIEDVVSELGIEVAKRSRRTLFCFAPWNSHHNPKLEIEIHPTAGKWNDWIAGRYGDALGLVACCLAGSADAARDKTALGRAITWAKEYYGYATANPEAWAEARAAAQAKAKKREAAAARELSQARGTAQGLWLRSADLTPGDPVWSYLLARGIDLAQLPRLPRVLRCSLDQRWHDEAGDVGHVGPAMMAWMVKADGKGGALHRTWLDPDRPGQKADLAPPRKMWPASDGCVIRLHRGETGLTNAEAVKAGVIEDVTVCEGIEDGLSIALMTPEFRVEAVGSLPGLLSYVPSKHVRKIVVAADNDWGKPQAEALLMRACRRLAEDFGKQVAIARSPEGKDFNDLLRGE